MAKSLTNSWIKISLNQMLYSKGHSRRTGNGKEVTQLALSLRLLVLEGSESPTPVPGTGEACRWIVPERSLPLPKLSYRHTGPGGRKTFLISSKSISHFFEMAILKPL